MRIVLLGNTGAGKSATGNGILMKEVFEENDDPVMGTKEAKTIHGDLFSSGRAISVTDTPGFHSTNVGDDIMCKKIFQFIGQISPGPHVIIIVMSTKSRVSEEIKRAVKASSEILGEKSTDYIIFVFTHIDALRRSRGKPLTPIKEWVDKLTSQDEKMKKIIVEKCRERYVGFNNSLELTSPEHKSQVKSLMGIMEAMLRHNGGRYHTNQEIAEVENIMKELDEKTGSRAESQNALSGFLGFSAGSVLAGATSFGTFTAVEVGVGLGTFTEIASSAAVGAGLGLATAASGVAVAGIIAGITIGAWKMYRGMKSKIYKDAKAAIKSYKPKP